KEFLKGERESRAVIDKVKKIIEKEQSTVIEYVKVCDKGSLTDLERIEEGALLAVAVRIGETRLIDNCILSK
ncbi:MAG: pantoate--beta-alanine ligase, partial [Deltaproteobacteria bacterium]|nr:pantoate--beta-alanine ligase [Deltaproteobacteria bacterium]